MVWRRLLKWIGLSLAGAGFMLTVVLTALWFWSTSDTSLGTAINLASSYLPAGQSLTAEGVMGNLRQGGHIERLRWEMDGLVVEAWQVDLKWQPKALLDRRLQLDSLHVVQLNVEDKRPSSPLKPVESLVWASHLDVNFALDQVNWAPSTGAGVSQASGLSQLKGHYTFDGEVHDLKLDNASFAQGQYSAQASLQARAPMRLDIQAQGKVLAPLPGNTQPLSLSATGSVRGTLANLDSTLEVGAVIQPAVSVSGAMTGRVSARLKPWASQPIVNAQGEFANLNLAALWPAAPRTLLTGSVKVEPDLTKDAAATAAGWRGQGHVVNSLSGPWDGGRLPVDTAKAQVIYRGGQWVIQSLDAELGSGRVQMTGELNNPLGSDAKPIRETGWLVVTKLRNINPASLYKEWPADRVQGQVEALGSSFKTSQVIEFEGQLNSSNPPLKSTTLKELHLRNASAKGKWMGSWSDGKLSLKELRLQTDDALLQGALDAHLAGKSASGQLELSMPGGHARIAGQISPKQGAGEFSMQIADAARTVQWLASLPGVPNGFGSILPRGNGDVQGAWQGGWQDTGASIRGRFHVPFLAWGAQPTAAKSTLSLNQFDAELSGNLAALTFKANGLVEYGLNRFGVQTQATGSKDVAGNWHARVNQLQGQRVGNLEASNWAAQINQPFELVWRSKPNDDLIEAGGGEARLTGRGPGAVTLAWQPLRWRNTGKTQELQSKGTVKGISIGWLDELAGAGLAAKGLQSDLIFDGEWDVLTGATVKAGAAFFRRSGDISLQAEGLIAGSSLAANQRVSAGIQQLRIGLDLADHTLVATASWKTEKAGLAEGKITTDIQGPVMGWNWSEDAPLAGVFQAQLPQLGVWSAIAPPGWRIRGTLDANMALAGTRQAPQWSGTLNADNLEIRSVAEGIEFSKGKLRTRLNGQRLEIEDFTLQGNSGGGSVGGQVSAKGFAIWSSEANTATSPLAKTRLELDVNANALRVSARADRRMSISGNLHVSLQNAKMEVRGALKTDQALFILPEEGTPSLGEDVMVRSSAKVAPSANRNPPSNASPTQGSGFVPEVAITLDMGPDFRVQGRGLTTRLAGTLEISSSADSKGIPRIVGTLSTVGGRYRAYGQQLDVEAGILRFSGPYDNPALDILAIRPNLVVRVGVQVSGTALLPRVRLYADPELAETEKLAWLVLGRSAANGGAESAVLQQAALALLGKGGKGLSGGLTEALGLDELSYRGAATNADGTSSVAAVTLGKRLSRNFYVAYERSVAGTLGTVNIFYDLTKRFTLRAQAGEQSAIDLIFTVPYD